MQRFHSSSGEITTSVYSRRRNGPKARGEARKNDAKGEEKFAVGEKKNSKGKRREWDACRSSWTGSWGNLPETLAGYVRREGERSPEGRFSTGGRGANVEWVGKGKKNTLESKVIRG